MGQIDDVLERLRGELGDEPAVRDVEDAVAAMARAFRQATTGASAMSGSAVARMLGISRQAVNQRAGRGSLLAAADPEGIRYPIWQFRDGTPVEGLSALVRAARSAGVNDASLALWIEANNHRRDAVIAGRAVSLVGEVSHARRSTTPLNRRRVSGPAPELSDDDPIL